VGPESLPATVVRDGALSLQVSQTTQLFLEFSQDTARQRLESANKPAVVDRATLVDHDLALLLVPRDPSGKGNSKEILSGESGRARKNPGRRMFRLVEEISLNDEDRPDFAGFRAETGVEIGEIQKPPPDLHGSSRPSAAR
jgi:hypothetical protein